jgi:hypothetical protein
MEMILIGIAIFEKFNFKIFGSLSPKKEKRKRRRVREKKKFKNAHAVQA